MRGDWLKSLKIVEETELISHVTTSKPVIIKDFVWFGIGVKILPGVTLNLSKSGPSLSFGVRGAKFTVGPGGKRMTAGIPGTGMFYTKILKDKGGTAVRHSENKESKQELSGSRLTLGFFKRLITPEDEREFVDGCREFSQGNDDKALESFEKSIHLADGAYMAALLAFRRNKLEQAGDGWE